MAVTKKDGTIIIDTLINTKGFNSGVGNMKKSVSGLTSTIGKLGVAIGLAFSARAVINFGKECINLGSDLQEVQNVVDVTFGNMSDRINEFAKNAITQFGLSELAAKQYASTMGAMLKSMGFNQADVLEMSTTLAGLAGDIASFYNLTGDEAFTKIRAGISGETEPLKQLGINLSVANLEAFALAQGLTKSYNAMTEQEKAMLRYNYLLKTTADAQGDFARTSDSWANQTRILTEQFNSLKATIGQGLINVLTPVVKFLNVVLAKLQSVANTFKALTEYLFGKKATQQASSNLGAVEDGYSGVADATKKAQKAQDKYTNSLDELNVISQDDFSYADNFGGGFDSSLSDGMADATEEADGLFDELEKRFPRLLKFLDEIKKKLKEIVDDIKRGDFRELGKDISELAVLILDFISESIDLVDWQSIGEKIGDFLAGINWIEVVKSAFKLKFNIWKAIAEVWFGFFQAAPIETSIMTALALLKFSGLGALLANNLKTALLTYLPGAIKDAFSRFGSWIPIVAMAGAIVGVANQIIEAMKGAFDTSEWSIWDWIYNTLVTSKEGWMMQLDMWRVELEVWWQDTWLYNELWNLSQWWETYIAPWFTQEQWLMLFDTIRTSLNTKWTETSEEWKTNLANWWNNGVKTWFKAEDWKTLLDVIPNSFSEAFETAKSWVVTKLQEIYNAVSNMISSIASKIAEIKNAFSGLGGLSGITAGVNIGISSKNVPFLATGAVIPPNAPFMAMLGDQRHGTNLEAPESLIRQIVREEAGGSAEMMALLSEIAQNTRETADKDLTIGDRDIARANIRGQQSMGYSLITVG